MSQYAITIENTATASGLEWFLNVGGTRVETNGHGVGIFTGCGVSPEEMLPRLLRRVAAAHTEEQDGR